MTKLIAVGLVLIAGCSGGVSRNQNECLANNQRFSDVAACLRSKNMVGPGNSVDDYMLRVNMLEQQVKAGRISDIDAKMALQDYYVRQQASY